MRDIRFRAWDGKTMHYFPLKHEGDMFNLIFSDGKIRLDAVNNGQVWDVEIMQYTGLTDRLGKEIYEGDILQYWQAAGGSTKYKLDSRLRTVRWNEKGSVAGFNIGAARSRNGGTPTMNWEIVGNIYQNPELLNG